jgi:hypothetical protein
MRRFILALVAGLAVTLGTSLAAGADRTEQLTLACSDGTTISVSIDTGTLIDLNGDVQALNPAGLTCTASQDLLSTDSSASTVGTDPVACTATDFTQDGNPIPLTAAMIDPPLVTGPVDASGCDIGVYYDAAATDGSMVSNAEIKNAKYYGVLYCNGNTTGNGTCLGSNPSAPAVNVESSYIHNIGDVPFDGSQHGVGISYTGTYANGTVDGNTVKLYQKNGMAMKNGASVAVTNNMVTGFGPTKLIAQNGIEFLNATAPNRSLTGNRVNLNIYTQNTSCAPTCVGSTVGVTATGFLLMDTNFKNPGQVAPYNHAYQNQVDYYVVSS